VAVGLVCALWPMPVWAQPGGPWEVSALGGIAHGGDLGAGVTDPVVMGTVALAVGAGLGLEAGLSWVDRLDWLQPLDVVAASGGVRYGPVSAGPLTPYAVGVLSLVRLRPEPPAGAASVQPAFELGGGVELWLRRRLALRLDSRFVHIDDAPNFWRTVGGLTIRLR